MIDVESQLRETFRQHERGVVVRETLLESAVRRAGRRQRHRRVVVTVCAGVALAASAIVISANLGQERSNLATEGPIDPAVLDIGPVELLPPGDDTVLEAPGVFVLRTTDGEITAFSQRAPKEGCRLVLATDLEDITLDPEVVFHDPCHGQNFDRDGRSIGGPGLRGMYRYDLSTERGRILVDTSLARPGPYLDGIEGAEMSVDRRGPTDDDAMRWREALETAANSAEGSDPGPFVWPLGAFHDPATDVVTVPFTIDGLAADLQVAPEGALPELVVPDPNEFVLDVGRLVISTPREGSVLHGEMNLADGRMLRIRVLIPTCQGCQGGLAPSLDDLAALIDRASTAAVE